MSSPAYLPATRLLLLLGASLVMATAMNGCSGARQIQATPPQPALSDSGGVPEAPRRGYLAISLEMGPTTLPNDIQSIRFRITEILLKEKTKGWTAFPADINTFEVSRERSERKMILSTQVTPARYDSIAVAFNDIYVTFDANAGGPLTMARNRPVHLGTEAETRLDRRTLLRLTFEPGASIQRSEDCRWFFLPFLTVSAE